MAKPTCEDATLYMRLFSVIQNGLPVEARRWFFEHFAAQDLPECNQKYPTGSIERD